MERVAIRGYRRQMRWLFGLWLLPACLLACGDKSAVSLSVEVKSASLSVEPTPFGDATLSGLFQLVLSVGPEASGSSTVSLGNFSLENAAGVAIVDVLTLPTGSAFPLVVAKGSSQQVSQPVSAESVDSALVCPGPVRIVGSLMDSLKGGTVPVRSELITPDCPPAT